MSTKIISPDSQTKVIPKDETTFQQPRLYRVILLNDDYTTREFVVWVLQMIFHKSQNESVQLMLEVHTKGKGIAGVYPYDIARTKAHQVMTLAEKHEYPLKCIIECEESC